VEYWGGKRRYKRSRLSLGYWEGNASQCRDSRGGPKRVMPQGSVREELEKRLP